MVTIQGKIRASFSCDLIAQFQKENTSDTMLTHFKILFWAYSLQPSFLVSIKFKEVFFVKCLILYLKILIIQFDLTFHLCVCFFFFLKVM